MEKGILRKRLKGLLALSLAFYLLFGNGIQVLATEYDIEAYDIRTLNTDEIINAGSKIKYYYYVSGGAVINTSRILIENNPVNLPTDVSIEGENSGRYLVTQNFKVVEKEDDVYGVLGLGAVPKYNIDISPNSIQGGSTSGGGMVEERTETIVTATPNTGYKFTGWKENGQTVSEDSSYTFTVSGDRNLVAVFEEEADPGNTPHNPPTAPNGNQEAAKVSSGGTHTHSLRWEIVQEPTETVAGRSEYRCECGHVEAAQPISFFGAIIKQIIKSIEEAPQNGTVVVENKFLRCLTDEIMEALHKRSDVNLEVKFSEQGVNYHFLIPATAAPTEEEEWFGYFYLGGRYGWLQ